MNIFSKAQFKLKPQRDSSLRKDVQKSGRNQKKKRKEIMNLKEENQASINFGEDT